MGEAADMLLEGLLCEQCGELIDGDEPGYPRLCLSCERDNIPHKKRLHKKKKAKERCVENKTQKA